MIRKAFVTGSRAYGIPRHDSDIDLVILVDKEDLNLLLAMGQEIDEGNGGYDPEDARCLRFGTLNLLCCLSAKHFDVWKTGTEILKKRALGINDRTGKKTSKTPPPGRVSREDACSFLNWWRNKHGIKGPS